MSERKAKRGRPRKPLEPDGTFTQFEVDVIKRILAVQDRFGLSTPAIYTALGWPEQTWYGKASRGSHWTVSQVVEVVAVLRRLIPEWRPPVGFPWVDPGTEEKLAEMEKELSTYNDFRSMSEKRR